MPKVDTDPAAHSANHPMSRALQTGPMRSVMGIDAVERLRGGLPSRGLTLLAVEDSRFAAEALRLMCRRLGLRLRRAEDLRNAHLHLRLYRPDVVLVDLSLPDGRGEALIRELALSHWRPKVILAMSGDHDGRMAALAAGADGFIDKPLESLAAFREVLERFVPELQEEHRLVRADYGLPPVEDAPIVPDRLALHDDLAHAAALLKDHDSAETRSYLAKFLGGVAAHAHDDALANAARAEDQAAGLKLVLEQRLAAGDGAFGRA